MYIAHSALRTNNKTKKPLLKNNELAERYLGYQTACNKYRAEIAAIQQYIPGWLPPFERKAF
ncbi:hypothetical protein ACFQZI_10165 [Mucilaginibacter lutimaris]|uniref:Uncharacterized protein n=1 Tax=Mucilaginibacter lutimaris TaxID=931629 RepID=A0ABW2ZG91_9SPHI